MKPHPFIPIIIICLFAISINNTNSQDKCDTKLGKIKQIEGFKEKYEKLKDLAEKCPEHIQTFRLLSIYLVAHTSDLGEDWSQQALYYTQKMLTLDSNYITSHFLHAQTLEYIGEYEKAALHYQKSIDIGNEKLDNPKIVNMVAEARIHLITCNFLAENFAQEENKTEQPTTQQEKDIDTSVEAISERAGWNFLKELTANVAVTAGLTALEGEGQHIQYALQLLYDWIEAPTGQEVIERNQFLAGMVSTIATIIIEKQLDIDLPSLYNPETGETKPLALPEANYAGEMEQEFRDQTPQEGRTFEITDDFMITEKWDVPDISGEWKIVYSGTFENDTGQRKNMNEVGKATILQNGPHIEITFTSDSYEGWTRYQGSIKGKIINDLQLLSKSNVNDMTEHYNLNKLTINDSNSQIYWEFDMTLSKNIGYKTIWGHSKFTAIFTRQ